MSTEALNLDQAVEKFMAPEEPVQEENSVVEEESATIEETDVSEDVEADTDVGDDSPDDDSEYESEYDDEDATDEESAEYDDEPEPVEPSKFTVKVDGEEVEVTLEDLKRSYSGQGKIQKGMQEAAEARKQAQQMQQQMAQAAQHLSAMYQKVQQEGFKAPPQEPSREMFDSDPIGYMEAKMQYDAELKEFNEQQGQMMQLQQYRQQQAQAEQQQRIQQEAQLLMEKIPELSEPEKAGKFREDLVRTASEFYGYSPEDMQGVTDHRALMVLRDAMMWRKSQSKRTQAEEKAKKARPVIKPQAKRTVDPKRKAAQKAKTQLKKSGDINDAIDLLFR